MTKIQFLYLLGLSTLVIASTGCSSVGDIIVKPHPHSDVRDNELVCLTTGSSIKEAAPSFIPIITQGIGFLVDQVSRTIERESKRYQSTYSARVSEYLFTLNDKKGAALRGPVFTLTRYIGATKIESCSSPGHAESVLSFEGQLNVSSTLDAIRIIPKKFVMTKSKSKVAASDGAIDVNIQITLSGVATTKEGVGVVDIGRVDFPMGKVNLNGTFERNDMQLEHLASPWIALPAFQRPTSRGKYGAYNMTVTVMEANDLGDVIGKGAAILSEHRAEIVGRAIKTLGLDKE